MKANHPLFSPHRFELGMFCSNLDGGLSATVLPERGKASCDGSVFGPTNYLEDLPLIRPRLEAKGLREPAESLVSA
jgi:hypothetical protein